MTKIRLLLTSIRISKEIYPLNDPSSRWFLWSRKISASWRTNLKLRLWISKQFENFITGWKWDESYVKQFWLVVVNCFGKIVIKLIKKTLNLKFISRKKEFFQNLLIIFKNTPNIFFELHIHIYLYASHARKSDSLVITTHVVSVCGLINFI